jgi:hypothetical protein
MGATHFRTRGLKNVATEASLTILAYNMKRAIAGWRCLDPQGDNWVNRASAQRHKLY